MEKMHQVETILLMNAPEHDSMAKSTLTPSHINIIMAAKGEK
jgi:hypothetical protein